jgi:hypothetical protein
MKFLVSQLVIAMLLVGPLMANERSKSVKACLPEGISLNEVVTAKPGSRPNSTNKVTVKQTLERLKARCRSGKLVDGLGKEIYFHRLIGCWGNPPADYQEQLKQQATELQRLKKKYTVVAISCDQELDPRQIH